MDSEKNLENKISELDKSLDAVRSEIKSLKNKLLELESTLIENKILKERAEEQLSKIKNSK